jgi:hypothetical protein
MGVLSLAGVTIMNDVIAAFEHLFGDGSHLCDPRDGPGRQPCWYTPVQVAAAFLDARNLPCNFLPPNQEPAGWNVLGNMLIDLINEDRVAVSVNAYGTDTEEGGTSWLDGERHGQLRGHSGGDRRQGDWIVEVAHRPSTQE